LQKTGTTSEFAVLAGSTITNTGTSIIHGNIGLHPGTVLTGQETITVTGTIHLADDVAALAKNDLQTAYNTLNGLPAETIASELGATTLFPGIYVSTDTEFHITGTLTLDAQGDPNAVFVFQAGSTLTTASDSNVNLINGAVFSNVYWKVGSSATIGTYSHFEGRIMASESITATTGSTINGQLLALTGAVTLDNNSITMQLPEIPEIPEDDAESPELPETPEVPEDDAESPELPETPEVPEDNTESPELPEDAAELPKTGTMPLTVLYGLGALLTSAGFLLVKRNK